MPTALTKPVEGNTTGLLDSDLTRLEQAAKLDEEERIARAQRRAKKEG